MKPGPKVKTAAERQAERRKAWAQLAVEITPEQEAKLQAVTAARGVSRKALIAELIDSIPEPDQP